MIHTGLRIDISIEFHAPIFRDRLIFDSHTVIDEHNRVKLIHKASGLGSDYINASLLEVEACSHTSYLTKKRRCSMETQDTSLPRPQSSRPFVTFGI